MRTELLTRYEKDTTGRFLIDVAADGIEDLYSHFDRNAPYIRRDLDQELSEYLVDSAAELEKHAFGIQFSFRRDPDADAKNRISHSVNQFFNYLSQREHHQFNRQVRKSLLLLFLGLLILFIAVWANQLPGPERSVLGGVFAQGLTVAAWVALWEALATILIEWFPHRRQIAIYKSLASAPLTFVSREAAGSAT